MLHMAEHDILSSVSSNNALERVRTIMRLGRALPNMLAAELENLGQYELGTAQVQILLELGRQQLSFEHLVEQGNFNEVCAWNTIQALKAAGYVTIETDDSGADMISASTEGLKVYETLVGTASNLSVRPVLRVVPGNAQSA